MQNGKYGKKVSVIVPVYNAKRYLEKCLSSLVNQTYENTEIIVVDDGSTDESGRICDRYAARFSQVHCYHKDNQGAGQARNFGMDHAAGDYIMFVDADDYIAERCVSEAVSIAEQYQADLVDFGKVFMLSAQNVFIDTDKTVRHFRSPQEVRQAASQIQKMIWGKLYKRELALGVRFNDWQRGEDACYMAEILQRCESLVKYNHCLYAYRAYQDSLTRGEASVRMAKRELGRYRAAYECAGSRRQKEEALINAVLYCQKTAEDIIYRKEEVISRKLLLYLKEQMQKIGQISDADAEKDVGEDAVTDQTEKGRSLNETFKKADKVIEKAIITSQASRLNRAYKKLRNLCSRGMGRIKVWIDYEYKIK